MKSCTNCNVEKNILSFSKSKYTLDGLNRKCKDCQSSYYKSRKSEHRLSVIAWENKRNKSLRDIVIDRLRFGCIDCGESNILTLEFDHREKKDSRRHSISTLMNDRVSDERLIEEINKCDTRCANCHVIKTAHDRGYWKIGYLTIK